MAVDDLFAQFFIECKNKRNEQVVQDEEEIRSELLGLLDELKSKDINIQLKCLEKLKIHFQKTSANISQIPSFLKHYYDKVNDFKDIYNSWPDTYDHKKDLSNLISVLSIIKGEQYDCLRYRLRGRRDNLSSWGIEYVRHLTEDLRIIGDNLESAFISEDICDFQEITKDITLYYLENNCELDAIDLNFELNSFELVEECLTSANSIKMLSYLQQLAVYSSRDDYLIITKIVFNNFCRFNYFTHAIISACRILDIESVHQLLIQVKENHTKYSLDQEDGNILQTQISLMLAHFGMYSNISTTTDTTLSSSLQTIKECIRNKYQLYTHEKLAIELDIVKPYSPDDIFKISGQKFNTYYSAGYLSDPSMLNLASCMVSSLVNCAYKTDTLLLDQSMSWMIGQRDYGLMSCVSSIGCLYLWDIEEALLVTDKFINSTDKYVRAGGVLALGIASSNSFDPFEANIAIMLECLDHSDMVIYRNAVMAFGLAYAGTDDRAISENLYPFMHSSHNDNQSKALAALSLGMISVGTPQPDNIYKIFVDTLMNMQDKVSLSDPWIRMIPVGLGLIYLCKSVGINADAKILSTLPNSFGKWCKIILKVCTNAGSGNPCVIQKLLQFIYDPDIKSTPTETVTPENDKVPANVINEEAMPSLAEENIPLVETNDIPMMYTPPTVANEDKSIKDVQQTETTTETSSSSKSTNSARAKKDAKKNKEINTELEMVQGIATIGIAIVAMNDDISIKMAVRLLNDLLQFGSIGVKRAVPIALSIMYASYPEVNIIELLSKLSHDSDLIVSVNAIIGLGVISAGTNNSRVSSLLKNLNIYFYRDPSHLFAIRLAQSLVHLSKGVMTISPRRAECSILSPPALGSLFIHAVFSLDVSFSYLNMDTRLFFWLVPAMKLRALVTYDQNFNLVPVSVKVGQAVEEIGQAGKPKKVTGFQTLKTPVLIDTCDKAELATDKYVPYTHILEGIVIVKSTKASS